MFRKKEGIVLRKIHGLYYLIDIKCNYTDDKCYLYETNEIGAFLWENLDRFPGAGALAHELWGQITDEVEEEVILADVRGYLKVLQAESFIEEI